MDTTTSCNIFGHWKWKKKTYPIIIFTQSIGFFWSRLWLKWEALVVLGTSFYYGKWKAPDTYPMSSLWSQLLLHLHGVFNWQYDCRNLGSSRRARKTKCSARPSHLQKEGNSSRCLFMHHKDIPVSVSIFPVFSSDWYVIQRLVVKDFKEHFRW